MNRVTVTVYCDAESHKTWEQAYHRDLDGEDVWLPDPLESIGGQPRKARRHSGMVAVAADGRPTPTWDHGRPTADFGANIADIRDPVADARNGSVHARARRLAGVGDEEQLKLGRSYVVRCAKCGEDVPRSPQNLARQFNSLAAKGITRISVSNLRWFTGGVK